MRIIYDDAMQTTVVERIALTDGQVELFNVDKILNITPYSDGLAKILIGAGMYHLVRTDSIQYIDCINDLLTEIKGG